jgi:hypothetical protein
MPKDDEDLARDPLTWSHPARDEIDELDKRIDEHPGKRLADRLDQLTRVIEAWAAFSVSFGRLLDECENDDGIMSELVRNVGDFSNQRRIILSLDQSVIAYTAGLGAVIDQSRDILRAQSEPIREEYDRRAAVIKKDHPGGPFLAKLRNYVLHYVAAPWSFSGSFGEDATGRVELHSASLLEAKKGWSADAKAFIAASGETIRLSPLIAPYMEAMIEHVGWIHPTIIGANADLLHDCDELIKKRNLLLSAGATDGHDWEDRVAHMLENRARAERGEPQTDYRTGLPIVRHDNA